MTAFRIVDHKLEPAKQVPTRNFAGPYRRPVTLLVMHYTASGLGIAADAAYFADQSKTSASAHLLVGKAGDVIQCVTFDKVAHHAGGSVWRGQHGCNDFSIGIEVDNWGILTKREDGFYHSWSGKVVDKANVIQARHKHRAGPDYWETYPEVQLRTLQEITRAILRAYPSIREVVGHDDIAPSRKTDPGPAFPLRRFQLIAEDRARPAAIVATVTASKLNVRTGPGIQHPKLDWGPLAKGASVKILNDGPEWDQIESGGNIGWVADEWLERA